MNFSTDIFIAFGLDVLIGDPKWLPHPVIAIGKLINFLEKKTRVIFRNERLAGTITGLLTVIISGAVVYLTILIAKSAGDEAARIVTIIWLYLGLSARSLSDAGGDIFIQLQRGDLPASRKALSCIVGRDTEKLDESEISRGAVESVSENTVDGILTPLFFALIGAWTPFGAAAMMWAFKAMSTCDSMIGHKDEKYIRFGTFSARLDDVANYIPARLCYILFPLAALISGYSPFHSLRTALKDSKNHDSPNAGIPEAATAGALKIKLGGTVFYDGIRHDKKPFGPDYAPPERKHILQSIRLMWIATLLMLILVSVVYYAASQGFV